MTLENTLAAAPLAPESTPTASFRGLHFAILAGVTLGTGVGLLFGTQPIALGITTADLGQMGMLVIRLLKALAVPLVLFAILNSLTQNAITGRKGVKLVLICLLNVSVAAAIALTILNVFEPGLAWRERIAELSQQPAAASVNTLPKGATLDPMQNLAGYVPANLLQPFLEGNLISVVLIAIFVGAAMRRAQNHPDMRALHTFVRACYELLLQMLQWVIRAVPVAVFLVVAQAVGRSGLEVFTSSVSFLVVVVGGLLAHALIYYTGAAWIFGRLSPARFLRGGADAILTGMSTNSSLATVPVTLDCLTRKLGVSKASATLSTCIGTNLNNDGVTLYEAITALFLAQACGMQFGFSAQLLVILAALMAAVGCAGIPESGLVVLPLVLAAAGLPDWLVATAIPLLLPIDWFVARVRSIVNVMSDMTVAIMLDGHPDPR